MDVRKKAATIATNAVMERMNGEKRHSLWLY